MPRAGTVPSKYCANVETESGPPSPPIDPVFAVIEAHRRAAQVELVQLAAAMHAEAPADACAERAAILALLTVRPTTLAGFAAWLAYLGGPNYALPDYSASVFVNAIESADEDVAAAAAGFVQHAAMVFRELVSSWVKSDARSSGSPTSSACPSAR